MKGIKMTNEHLKQLHDLQFADKLSAEAIRVQIECIFRKDYWEEKIAGKSKTKDEYVDECLLQEDRMNYAESLGNKSLY